MAPGLCVGPQYVMAQATHGSAPDIAGRGLANPYAMIMSAQMLLSWLGNKKSDPEAVQAARDIESGMEAILCNPRDVTPDLGGSARTPEMADALCKAIAALPRQNG